LTERANSARVDLISKAIDFARLADEGALADDRKVASRHR